MRPSTLRVSSVSLIYLAVGTVGLLQSISLAVVFSYITLMPRRNLGSHVCCSHMIEPLGARWCQGICDITHCNPLLCNLTSVLTSNPSQGYRVNERLVSRKRTVLRRVLYCVHRKLMHVCIIFYAPPRCIKHGHHHLCTMVYASLGQHHN